jgi:hypothetical protein
MMHRTEAIETNADGGQQSKLYTAYHLMDPRASFCHAAILHRGAIKYQRDNWRKIDAEQHVNRAIAHLQTWLEHVRQRQHVPGPVATPDPFLPEDDLAHALCRVHMALAKEIECWGIHPEHFDPQYHEKPVEEDARARLLKEKGCWHASHVTTAPVKDSTPGGFGPGPWDAKL